MINTDQSTADKSEKLWQVSRGKSQGQQTLSHRTQEVNRVDSGRIFRAKEASGSCGCSIVRRQVWGQVGKPTHRSELRSGLVVTRQVCRDSGGWDQARNSAQGLKFRSRDSMMTQGKAVAELETNIPMSLLMLGLVALG